MGPEEATEGRGGQSIDALEALGSLSAQGNLRHS